MLFHHTGNGCVQHVWFAQNGALIVHLARDMHKRAIIAQIIYELKQTIYGLKKTIYGLERLFMAQKRLFTAWSYFCRIVRLFLITWPRCVHPYRQGVTHDRSRKLKWPLFCALSRTKSQILPPILHKNKENFALQNTPFFTKSRTIFQNYTPICAKARTWFFAAFCITNQPNWYFWSQIVDSHYQSNPQITFHTLCIIGLLNT